MERLKAVPSRESLGLVQGRFFPRGLTRKPPGRLHPGPCVLLPPSKWRNSLGKGKSALFARPGEQGAHLSSLVFAELTSQLENRFPGVLHHPMALLFEGYPLPGQCGAVMNSGSLQSSVLLLLPRVTYARLASTRQVTCTGRLEGVTPSAGLWCCLEKPRSGLPASAPSPGSSSSPDLSQGWRILSKKPHLQAQSAMEQGGSLQSLLAPSQAGLARGRNSLGGEGAPQSSWELTDIPAPGTVSAHPCCGSAVGCTEQHQDHGYLGLGQGCTVVLSRRLSPM